MQPRQTGRAPMSTTTTHHSASPAKLRSGEWGALRNGETITFTLADDEPTTCDHCHDEIPVGGTGLLVPTGRCDGDAPVVVAACSPKCRDALLAKDDAR